MRARDVRAYSRSTREPRNEEPAQPQHDPAAAKGADRDDVSYSWGVTGSGRRGGSAPTPAPPDPDDWRGQELARKQLDEVMASRRARARRRRLGVRSSSRPPGRRSRSSPRPSQPGRSSGQVRKSSPPQLGAGCASCARSPCRGGGAIRAFTTAARRSQLALAIHQAALARQRADSEEKIPKERRRSKRRF